MTVLFEDGETLLKAKRWLEETNSSTQFHMTNAALILANMARSGMS